MKLDLKGLRFGIWLYYVTFALGMLALLGFLQISMIKPYYRDNKITAMKEVADTIQASMIDRLYIDEKDVETAFQTTVKNNVCAIIYNEGGQIVYSADSLGAGCIFSQSLSISEINYPALRRENSFRELFESNQADEISELFRNNRIDQEMILYGRKIKANMETYYLYVNSPVELMDFTYEVFQNQFGTLTIGVLLLSLAVSMFLSARLASPILKMRSSAKELAQGNYEISFEGGSFSETKELATALNDATAKLNKVDELRKDLLANVSHDIKTPLTMIKAYAEMIQDISGDIPEKRNEHLQVIIDEVEYLDHLVKELSELSKMQSGTYDLNITQFDLSCKVREITKLCQGLFEQRHMHYELSTVESVLVSADETKIGQVIYNFIVNAIKHSEEHTCVFITCQDFGDTVRVSVQDEGKGISEAELPYIWDRYYKIDKGFKRSSKGTGLGLSIVKAILDTHQADFGVDSKEGNGSTFWFELKKEDAK